MSKVLQCHRCDAQNSFIEFLRADEDAYILSFDGCPPGAETAMCRDCGLRRFFEWWEVGTLAELRAAIWAESNENLETVNRLKFFVCLYPPVEKAGTYSDNHLVAKYHNALVLLRSHPDLSSLFLPPHDTSTWPQELPTSRQDRDAKAHEPGQESPLDSAGDGRGQNEHSGRHDNARPTTRQAHLVFGASA